MQNEEQRKKQQARERLARRQKRSEERVQATSARQNAVDAAGHAPAHSPSGVSRVVMVLAGAAIVVGAFFAGEALRETPAPANSASAASSVPSAYNGGAQPQAVSQQDPDQAIDLDALENLLGEDIAAQLVERAKSDADVRWIASHPDEYAFDGYDVQFKILKLAAEEPHASDYVRNWPKNYPAYEQDTRSTHSLKVETTGNAGVPMLYQWDPRWAYTVYSSASFGLTGCCPTTMAMVYQGLTGKTDMTPYDMGMLAQNDGYMALYEGTDANFLINEAPGLGLVCEQLVPTSAALIGALDAGKVIIANVGPGDFTTDGHFIVITGAKNGKLIVNDPYSKRRSDKLWDPDEIIAQTKLFLAYEKAA